MRVELSRSQLLKNEKDYFMNSWYFKIFKNMNSFIKYVREEDGGLAIVVKKKVKRASIF